MTQIYKVGTATVTNGSTAVAGTDTGWAVAGVAGGLFTRNGLSVPIESVTDDDTLVLALPWPGPTTTGAYTIARENSAAASVVSLYSKMSEATVTMTLSQVPPSGVGSLAQRDELDLAPGQTEFIFLHMDEVGPNLFLEFYRWGGFAWIGPFPAVIPGTPGPAGGDGPPGEGFNPRGAWNNIDTYSQNDFVWIGPRNFVSKVDDNTGNEPPSSDADDANWQFVPTPPGTPGADGADGREVQLQVTATHIQWRYAGEVAWTDLIARADLKGDPGNDGANGSNGTDGTDGADGGDGWSPVLALVSDGNRRVVQVSDWVGGAGSKPATGDYVGASGLVSDIGSAVDVRGPSGAGSGDVTTSGSVTAQRVARFADATGDVIEDTGYTVGDLLARANHTGTQLAATISDFSTAADARVSAAINNTVQGYHAILAALAALNATGGMLVQTGASAFAKRTITGTANQIAVANGDGVSGAPTLSLPSAITVPGTLTLNADGSSAMHAVTKQQLDAALVGIGKRQRVKAATTANITISTALNNGDALDGVTLVTGDYVLVKNQTTASQNGIYVVAASPARAVEFDTYDEHPGSLITVSQGTTNDNTVWQCDSNEGGTLNTTAISFIQLRVAGELLAANNLSDLASAATARTNLGVGTGDSPQFTALNLGHASDTTIARDSAGVLSVEGKRLADLATENLPLSGGATVTSKALGTQTTGTLTLDMGDCPLQHYTANGAHTLAPGSVTGSCLVDITNGASAGAITTSGWTKVAGDPFTTTNGHKFRCHCSVGNGGSLLIVQALQ